MNVLLSSPISTSSGEGVHRNMNAHLANSLSFSRLYPCGECAAEFQALLAEYPPQASALLTITSLTADHSPSLDLVKKERFIVAMFRA